MSPEKNVRMTFICDQEWDAMIPTCNGRFCNVCNKEVFDYTGKKINQTGGENLCGRFDIEQTDSTLIKPIEVPRQIKFFAFISSLLLATSAKTTFGQTNNQPKTEQVEIKPIYADVPGTVQESTSNNTVSKSESVNKKPFFRTARKRFYWSRSFPFIKIKKKHLMGRFARKL